MILEEGCVGIVAPSIVPVRRSEVVRRLSKGLVGKITGNTMETSWEHHGTSMVVEIFPANPLRNKSQTFRLSSAGLASNPAAHAHLSFDCEGR